MKAERLDALQSVLNGQQLAFNATCVGRTLSVLLERQGRHPSQLVGRSPYMQAVHATLPAGMLGTIQPLRVVAAHANSLAAEAAEDMVA